MTPERIERAQQRCRAELTLGAARKRRWEYLHDLAATRGIELDPIQVDDELAVQRAARRLANAGAPVHWECLTVPTADQYLAGQTITPPPTTTRRP